MKESQSNINFEVRKRTKAKCLLGSLLATLVISGAGSASAATIHVDSLNDNVPGTITLDGERLRTSDETHDAANELTIDGGNSITVSGGNSSQVLLVVDTPLTLEGITIADGKANSGEPGGIRNYQPLTIRNSTLTGNLADDDGGAIYNTGSLDIVNSTLTANTAKNGSGGAIYNNAPSGTVVIRNSTISGNSAQGGGGGIYNADGDVQIINSTIVNNTGTDGGGITGGAAAYIVSNSIVANNISTGGGISDCDSDAAAYFTT